MNGLDLRKEYCFQLAHTRALTPWQNIRSSLLNIPLPKVSFLPVNRFLNCFPYCAARFSSVHLCVSAHGRRRSGGLQWCSVLMVFSVRPIADDATYLSRTDDELLVDGHFSSRDETPVALLFPFPFLSPSVTTGDHQSSI